MSSKKLKKAPLQEVVFRIQWRLPKDDEGEQYDPNFLSSFGIFASRIREQFPVQNQIVPENRTDYPANILTHQFRQRSLSWPVVQIGPGLLTVNSTEEVYTWDAYREAIDFAIKSLNESYPNSLAVKSLSLQYFDAVDVENDVNDPIQFVSDNFLITLRNNFTEPGRTKGLAIEQSFSLEDGSSLGVTIQTATNQSNKKNSIIWFTNVRKDDVDSQINLMGWLDFAHARTSEMFKELLNPTFYASFDE